MRKWMLSLLLAAALLLGGCGGGGGTAVPDVDIDPATAAAAILEQVDFVRADSMMKVEGEVASVYYSLGDGIADYAIYLNGFGASAEEIAVLKMADGADTAEAVGAVEARLKVLAASFEDYLPEEMVKINNAVVETRGNVVFFVTADDPQQARDVIDSFYQ